MGVLSMVSLRGSLAGELTLVYHLDPLKHQLRST